MSLKHAGSSRPSMPGISGEGIHPKRPALEGALMVVAGAIITVVLLPALIIWFARMLLAEIPAQSDAAPVIEAPIPCHSHNDFWREFPLFSALNAGCIGVEADVWAYEGELFVGHKRDALSPNRTFRALYVNPLLRELEARNRPSSVSSGSTPHGLFNSDPCQPLVLLVDIKADSAKSWPLLERSLEPLRLRGWLTSVLGGTMTTGPVTVVVTGDILTHILDRENETVPRDIFVDAPLSALRSSHYYSNISYWASASFTRKIGFVWLGRLRPGQLHQVREHVAEAHNRGLKARYWGLPSWPLTLRAHIWETLLREGVDIINVDDLRGVIEAWPKLRMR